jgi:hypothetical protein
MVWRETKINYLDEPMEDFKETNYSTVLDRIFIRVKTGSKWGNASLREARTKHPKQLYNWILGYVMSRAFGMEKDGKIEERDLLSLIEWMDRMGIPPVRITDEFYKQETEKDE